MKRKKIREVIMLMLIPNPRSIACGVEKRKDSCVFRLKSGRRGQACEQVQVHWCSNNISLDNVHGDQVGFMLMTWF